MSDIDYVKLRELAQAARPDGALGAHTFDGLGRLRRFQGDASPDVVLALLDEIDRLTTLARGRQSLGLTGIFAADAIGVEGVAEARDDYLARVWDEAIAAVQARVGDDGLLDQHRLIKLQNPYRPKGGE